MAYVTPRAGMGIDASEVGGEVRRLAVSATMLAFIGQVARNTARQEAALDSGQTPMPAGLSGGTIAVLVIAGLAAVGSAGYLVYTLTKDKDGSTA
jgi:hypothetical protein